MDNCIHRVEVRDRSMTPAMAEVWITVLPERRTETTEVRGRLMGPTCAYAGTVEVAYHLRDLPPGAAAPDPGLTRRVVIPEASLWEPECPFLYSGPVELWEDGRRCDQVTVRHGLRTMSLGSQGLRLNGRALTLRGRKVDVCAEEEMHALRRARYNLLLVPAVAETTSVWDLADRLGFLVIGKVTETDGPALEYLATLNAHACSLGWLVPAPGELRDRLPADWRVGVELTKEPPGPLAEGLAFAVGPAALETPLPLFAVE